MPKSTITANSGEDGMKAKKIMKYRPIVHAIRKIRKQQKLTIGCMLRRPLLLMTKEIINSIDPKTWLRPSTVFAAQNAVEGAIDTILREAGARRIESMSEKDKSTQRSYQVMAKNIEGAFKAWAASKSGNFIEHFDVYIKQSDIVL